MDRALWHKLKKARELFQKNKYWLQILLFPPATPIGTQQNIVGK
jgi:putative transposase